MFCQYAYFIINYPLHELTAIDKGSGKYSKLDWMKIFIGVSKQLVTTKPTTTEIKRLNNILIWLRTLSQEE